MAESDGLVLFSSIFGTGKILAGSHHTLKGQDDLGVRAENIALARIDNTWLMCQKNVQRGVDFFNAEEFRVKLIPNCDS